MFWTAGVMTVQCAVLTLNSLGDDLEDTIVVYKFQSERGVHAHASSCTLLAYGPAHMQAIAISTQDCACRSQSARHAANIC